MTLLRRFADERLRPIEDKVAESDKVPDEIVEEMKELGLFGISVPVEYGGLGLTMEEECLLMFELGRTSPAFRSAISLTERFRAAANAAVAPKATAPLPSEFAAIARAFCFMVYSYFGHSGSSCQ